MTILMDSRMANVHQPGFRSRYLVESEGLLVIDDASLRASKGTNTGVVSASKGDENTVGANGRRSALG